MWTSWRWDGGTAAVAFWIAWFIVFETVALARGDYLSTFTAHLRPIFLTAPVLWWVGVGAYVWLGVHVFAPSFEEWLAEIVVRGLIR